MNAFNNNLAIVSEIDEHSCQLAQTGNFIAADECSGTAVFRHLASVAE